MRAEIGAHNLTVLNKTSSFEATSTSVLRLRTCSLSFGAQQLTALCNAPIELFFWTSVIVVSSSENWIIFLIFDDNL
jgi:hypothetical protein